VALRQLAGYWARTGAPLPIYVELPSLRRQLGARHLTDLVVDVAAAMEPVADRDHLRVAIREAISWGDAALFLDGLDECRAETGAVVAALKRWIGELPSTVEIVIATRGGAYGAAHTLDLRELELTPPSDLDRFLYQLLEQYAEATGVPQAEHDRWIRTRVEWVGTNRAPRASIADTAFHQVLLAAYAAGQDVDGKPPNRARVYRTVVEGTLSRLEIRRRRLGELSIDGLDGESACHAALGAFAIIGSLEEGDPSGSARPYS
jgi:hypothetical protein